MDSVTAVQKTVAEPCATASVRRNGSVTNGQARNQVRVEVDVMGLTVKTSALEKTTIQCCVLLPKTKIEQFPEAFGHFLRELRGNFAGYSYDREISGSWIEHRAGIVHDDHHVVILVEIPLVPSCRETLKTLVSDAAHDLHELSLFVSISGGGTFFVWAREDCRSDATGFYE